VLVEKGCFFLIFDWEFFRRCNIDGGSVGSEKSNALLGQCYKLRGEKGFLFPDDKNKSEIMKPPRNYKRVSRAKEKDTKKTSIKNDLSV